MVKESLYHFAFRNQYDIIASEISKEIFQSVVSNNASFSKLYPKHKMGIEVVIERANTDYIEKVKNIHYVNFDIKAHNQGAFIENQFDSCLIDVKIILGRKFSDQDYQSLNYRLYEVIRHEIEHKKTFSDLGQPKQNYINLFDKLFQPKGNRPLLSHCQLMSQYILHPQELPSYAKSIYFYAKRSRKSFQNIISDVLNRSFFNDRQDAIKEGMSNPEILSLLNKTKESLTKQINRFFPNSRVIVQ